MSQITTNSILTYYSGNNGKIYSVVVLINNADFEKDPHQPLEDRGQITTQGLVYSTAVDMASISERPVVLKVNLGQPDIHQEMGEIDFTLFNGSSQIDHKRFKVKEAQDESRPFKITG